MYVGISLLHIKVLTILFDWDCCHLYQVAENLAQLMYSVMMTGYMFRNAQFRLELQQSLEQVALPEPQENKVTILYFFFFILLISSVGVLLYFVIIRTL